MTEPAASVIVLNWNGRALLPACLDALAAQRYRDFETLVVDNGSTDGSLELLASCPAIRVLALGENVGFAAGNNRGIEASTGRFVILLNNDTEADPDFVGALVAAAEAHPEAGLCASRMLRLDDRARIDSAGLGLTLAGTGYPIGAGRLDGPAFRRPGWVFGACAGAALYRRAMLEHIGGLDEEFFSHVEDTDLSFRAQLAGYRCRYVPEAVVYHLGGASSRRVRRDVLYRIQRNLTWAFLKDAPPGMLLALLPLHLAHAALWLGRAARAGEADAVWQAKRDVARGLASLRARRVSVQALRRRSSLELLRQITLWR
ncbi:MAG TPA: glycosyltransferase family 2 protein [Polyangia bacterium]|jgi:hypothetical protein